MAFAPRGSPSASHLSMSASGELVAELVGLSEAEAAFFDDAVARLPPGSQALADLRSAFAASMRHAPVVDRVRHELHASGARPRAKVHVHLWNLLLALTHVHGDSWAERWDSVCVQLGREPLARSALDDTSPLLDALPVDAPGTYSEWLRGVPLDARHSDPPRSVAAQVEASYTDSPGSVLDYGPWAPARLLAASSSWSPRLRSDDAADAAPAEADALAAVYARHSAQLLSRAWGRWTAAAAARRDRAQLVARADEQLRTSHALAHWCDAYARHSRMARAEAALAAHRERRLASVALVLWRASARECLAVRHERLSLLSLAWDAWALRCAEGRVRERTAATLVAYVSARQSQRAWDTWRVRLVRARAERASLATHRLWRAHRALAAWRRGAKYAQDRALLPHAQRAHEQRLAHGALASWLARMRECQVRAAETDLTQDHERLAAAHGRDGLATFLRLWALRARAVHADARQRRIRLELAWKHWLFVHSRRAAPRQGAWPTYVLTQQQQPGRCKTASRCASRHVLLRSGCAGGARAHTKRQWRSVRTQCRRWRPLWHTGGRGATHSAARSLEHLPQRRSRCVCTGCSTGGTPPLRRASAAGATPRRCAPPWKVRACGQR